MNKNIIKMIGTTVGQLAFALLSGLGYFMLIGGWILDASRGMWLMMFYLAPLVVCGAALVIVKMLKNAREAENNNAILKIFWVHICIIVLSIVFVSARFV